MVENFVGDNTAEVVESELERKLNEFKEELRPFVRSGVQHTALIRFANYCKATRFTDYITKIFKEYTFISSVLNRLYAPQTDQEKELMRKNSRYIEETIMDINLKDGNDEVLFENLAQATRKLHDSLISKSPRFDPLNDKLEYMQILLNGKMPELYKYFQTLQQYLFYTATLPLNITESDLDKGELNLKTPEKQEEMMNCGDQIKSILNFVESFVKQ